jgi:serine/threonine-protein kinase
MKPDEPFQHIRLGALLLSLGDSKAGEGEFFEAKCLKADDWFVRNEITNAFLDRGRYEPALAELREATRVESMKGFPHEALGRILLDVGRLDEALASLSKAVELSPGYAQAHVSLGRALLAKGDFEAALTSFRQSRRRSPRSPFRPPSGDLIRDAEQMIALCAHLPSFLQGQVPTKSRAELIRAARLCQIKEYFTTSAQLWEKILATQPGVVEPELNASRRYTAACAAASAAAGAGKENALPDRATRDHWRGKALEWLEADLAATTVLMDRGSLRERSSSASRLGRWLAATQFAEVRDQAGLAALPEPERHAWNAFWAKVDFAINRGTPKGAKATLPRAS